MDIWRHRHYIDFWSFVHLLSGMLLAAGCIFFALSFMHAFVLSAALLLAWEVLEWLAGISETAGNIVLDIVIGIGGFLLASYWYLVLGMAFDLRVVGGLAIVTAGLSLWGFLDMKMYGYR